MSNAAQWIIVAMIVTAAVIFLIRRLSPGSKNACCDGKCDGCSKQSVVKDCHEDRIR